VTADASLSSYCIWFQKSGVYSIPTVQAGPAGGQAHVSNLVCTPQGPRGRTALHTACQADTCGAEERLHGIKNERYVDMGHPAVCSHQVEAAEDRYIALTEKNYLPNTGWFRRNRQYYGRWECRSLRGKDDHLSICVCVSVCVCLGVCVSVCVCVCVSVCVCLTVTGYRYTLVRISRRNSVEFWCVLLG